VMVRTGDCFVLRTASPLATIGGGVITDSNAPRRARPMATLNLSAKDRAALFIAEAGTLGLSLGALPVRLGVPSSATQPAATKGVALVGDRLYAESVIASVSDNVRALVRAHHKEHPLEPGAPRQDIRSRLKLDPAFFDDVVARLVKDGALIASGASLKDASFKPELSTQEQGIGDELLAVLEAAGTEPPSLNELEAKFGKGATGVLRHLERQKLVVRVEDSRYYAPSALNALVSKLESLMAGKGELAPTDLREGLGFSRKFLIPFLEYCDRVGLTMRQGNGRVWRGHS
jgi:selenocysteine-specific elongation factor